MGLNVYSQLFSQLEWKGQFKMFFPNCFSCIKVNDDFSTISSKILSAYGFQEVSLMKVPDSPRTHISIMNNYEKKRVKKYRAYRTARKWQDCEVTFRIYAVTMCIHNVKNTQHKKLLCSFQIHSPTIDAIRIDLGCSPSNVYYNMHMTVCEKLL